MSVAEVPKHVVAKLPAPVGMDAVVRNETLVDKCVLVGALVLKYLKLGYGNEPFDPCIKVETAIGFFD